MSRRCDEVIDVRVAREVVRFAPGDRVAGALDEEVPDRFVWRGRFYLVHEVVGAWRERQAWWRHPMLRENASTATEQQERAASGAVLAVMADGADRHVWRVRASSGVSAPTGVYDLARDPLGAAVRSRTVGGGGKGGISTPASGPGTWRLVRVSD